MPEKPNPVLVTSSIRSALTSARNAVALIELKPNDERSDLEGYAVTSARRYLQEAVALMDKAEGQLAMLSEKIPAQP